MYAVFIPSNVIKFQMDLSEIYREIVLKKLNYPISLKRLIINKIIKKNHINNCFAWLLIISVCGNILPLPLLVWTCLDTVVKLTPISADRTLDTVYTMSTSTQSQDQF